MFSFLQVTLPELTPAGYAVLTVNATDLDAGLNGEITYSMGVAPVQGFTIDPITGQLNAIVFLMSLEIRVGVYSKCKSNSSLFRGVIVKYTRDYFENNDGSMIVL